MKKYFPKLLIGFLLLIPFYFIFQKSNDTLKYRSEIIEIFQTFSSVLNEEQKELLKNPILENLNTIAQKSFLRREGTERKDLPKNDSRFELVDQKKARILFTKIKDIGDVLPNKKSYDYVLLNGSTVSNMKERLNSLIRFVKENKIEITAKTKVIFLTGERDLFDTEIPLVPKTCKTEAEAAEFVWNKADLPSSLKTAHIIFIRSPKVQKADGTFTRPTTENTANEWMKQNPVPGTCLSISSQPFVHYQELTMKSVLPEGFIVEGVGYDTYPVEGFKTNVTLYLDNLARTIYTALTIKKKYGKEYL